jgi:hypothetical protein
MKPQTSFRTNVETLIIVEWLSINILENDRSPPVHPIMHCLRDILQMLHDIGEQSCTTMAYNIKMCLATCVYAQIVYAQIVYAQIVYTQFV